MHCDNAKSSLTNSDSFYEVFKVFDLIKQSVSIHRPDFIIFFGDVFNIPNTISSTVLTIFSKLISDIVTTSGAGVYFIVGNHDDVDSKYTRINVGKDDISIRSSLLSPFKYFENVYVFDKPTVAKLDSNSKIEIGYIPYSNNIKHDLDSIKDKFTIGTKKILMGHFEMQSNFAIMTNNRYNSDLPTPEELVNTYGYDMVLLGHIHDIYETRVNNKLLKYIGSCRNINFGNTKEEKGIYLLDFDTLQLTFIENKETNIYKVFSEPKDLIDYVEHSDKQKLARTKLRYIYRQNNEIQVVAKLKSAFKSVQFQKNMSTTITKNEVDINKFEDMIKSNLVTEDTLLDFVLQFKPPKDEKSVRSIFSII